MSISKASRLRRNGNMGGVRVTIVAAYTAMVELTREAVNFVVKRLPYEEGCTLEQMMRKEKLEFICASADAVQGETLDYMVLALPPKTMQWSPWLCDPSRLLTIMSRYRRQLAIAKIEYDGLSQHTKSTARRSVKAVVDLHKAAET